MKDSTIDRGGMSEIARKSAHALVSTVIFLAMIQFINVIPMTRWLAHSMPKIDLS